MKEVEQRELLRRLEELGMKVSSPTLARWARQKLIPAPNVRSLGRGVGRISVYPAAALGEAYAAAVFLRDKGFKVRDVASIRGALYKMAATPSQLDEDERRYLGVLLDFLPGITDWPILVAKVNEGWPLARPAIVYAWTLDEEGCISWHLQDADEDVFEPWI
ncbi:MAG: hypothetical protein ACOX44_04435 [Limnochordia bacterium]